MDMKDVNKEVIDEINNKKADISKETLVRLYVDDIIEKIMSSNNKKFLADGLLSQMKETCKQAADFIKDATGITVQPEEIEAEFKKKKDRLISSELLANPDESGINEGTGKASLSPKPVSKDKALEPDAEREENNEQDKFMSGLLGKRKDMMFDNKGKITSQMHGIGIAAGMAGAKMAMNGDLLGVVENALHDVLMNKMSGILSIAKKANHDMQSLKHAIGGATHDAAIANVGKELNITVKQTLSMGHGR